MTSKNMKKVSRPTRTGSMFTDGYYHLWADLEKYPDCWCYIVWSRRGPGKTYSSLWESYQHKIKPIYMKRTIDDVDLICSTNEEGFDPSPYAPINRDKGTNIRPVKIKPGIGAFYQFIEGSPDGEPVAYILAMNAIKKFKGFDFSECDWIIFDEFIPQLGERTSAGNKEGQLLLDLYMTVARDRQKRGKAPLKLILFANAEEISTPVTNELEVTDSMAVMQATGKKYILMDRGILLHHITEEEFPLSDKEKTGIYKGMEGTAWHDKAFGGAFANNDFSNIQHRSIKGYRCMIHLTYKRQDWYIWRRPRDGQYHVTNIPGKFLFSYNLNLENDQKNYWISKGVDLRLACIQGMMTFETYTMYDIMINFKKFFVI